MIIRKQLFILGLAIITTNTFASLERGIQGHNRGDIIAVRTDSEIAAWCDFSKQIVMAQPNTLCVYTGSKKDPTE